MMLKTTPQWDDIEKALVCFTSKSIAFPENEVFDQFVCLKNNIQSIIDNQNAKDEDENHWEKLSASRK